MDSGVSVFIHVRVVDTYSADLWIRLNVEGYPFFLFVVENMSFPGSTLGPIWIELYTYQTVLSFRTFPYIISSDGFKKKSEISSA